MSDYTDGQTVKISDHANLVWDEQTDPTNPGWVLEYEMARDGYFGQEIIAAEDIDEATAEARAFVARNTELVKQ